MISNNADSFNSQEFSRRLSVLEKEVERLKRQRTTPAGQKKWWHAIAGTFDGDPVYARIANEGRKWRQSQRKSARGAERRTKGGSAGARP